MDDEREVPSQLATVDTSIGSPGDVLTYLGPNFVPRFRPITGAGLGNVTGPATTTVDFVPQWNNTTGTLLKNGLPVSIIGAASSLVETDAGGKIAASVIPNTGVTPGTYSSANITVLADGRLSAASSGAAAGIGDAPAGPTVYGRNTGAWLPVVPLTGATMTGQLLLPVPAGPTSAATKGYVDTAVSGLAPLVSPNFSGVPTAPNQVSTDDSTRLATTHFVKMQGYTGSNQPISLTGDVVGGPGTTSIPTTIANTVGPATVSGITFNNRGLITAAVNQGYITAASGAFVPSVGGTISGTTPGTLTINRAGTLPASPTGVIPALWLVSGAVENCSAVIDTFATPTSFMVRRANGTAAAPTRLSTNDAFGQLAWRGFYGPTAANPGSPTGYGLTVARVEAMALEDFDQTHQGTQIQFRTALPGATAMTVQANLGPGLTVGPAVAPAGGMLVGDVDGVRLFQNGQPITTSASLSAALAGYVPTAGGTISGTTPGTLTISRNTMMPAAPAAAVLPLWMVAADTDLNPLFGMDAFNTQLGMMLRRANGTAASPTRIVNNERMGNLAWRGYADTHYGLTSARIAASALEDYHDTAQGTQIVFETTAVGTIGVSPQVAIGPGLTVGSPTPPAGGMQIGDGNFSRVLLNGLPVTGGGASGPITLSGDVTGTGTTAIAATVERMRGRNISTIAPTDTQVLSWNASSNQWEPAPPSVGASTGTVAAGIAGQITWYASNGTTVSGNPAVTTTAAGSLTVNRSPAMLPTPVAIMPAIWVTANTGENASIVVDSIATPTSLLFRRANTTAAAPSRLAALDGFGQVAYRGYFGPTTTVPASAAGFSLTVARMQAVALEDFDESHQGTALNLQATPRGSTAIATVASFRRGVVVGSPAGGTFADGDMGPGTLNAELGLYINGTLVGTGAGGISQLTGDVLAGPGSGSVAATINNTITAGSAQGITYNARGLITATVNQNYATTAALAGYLPLTGGTLTGPLVINANTTMANVPAFTGMSLLVNGADASASNLVYTAYAGNPSLNLLRAQGAPGTTLTPPTNAQVLGRVSGGGWTGAAWTPGKVGVEFIAAESWSGTVQGTLVNIFTTTPGGTALATEATFGRGITVGAPTGTQPSPATGDINAHRIFIDGVAVGTASATVNPGTGPQIAQYPAGTSSVVGGVTLSGDVTIAQGGATTIGALRVATGMHQDASITLAKMENRTAGVLIGRGNTTTGVPQEVTLGSGLSMSGTVLTATGGATGLSGMTLNQVPIAATATTVTSSMATTGTTGVARIVSSTAAAKTASNLAMWDANGNLLDAGAANTVGTVTSVGMTVPGSIFSVGGSPIATAGTLAMTVAGTSGGIPYFSSGTALGTSGLLAANAIVLGGGAGVTPATMASNGTSVQVLHGGGPPTWGAVSLATDVSGVLQAAQEPAHTGDVTNTAGSLALTIQPNVVTYAKMQTVAANRLLGSGLSGTAVAEITLGTNLSFTGTQLNAATGGGGGVGTSVVNRVPYYDTTTTVMGNPAITSTTAGSLTVNRNAAASPAGINITALQVNWADTENGTVVLDAHGTASTAGMVLRTARGTGAQAIAPNVACQTLSGDNLGNIQWRGYENTTPGYAGRSAMIYVTALENFTSSARGAALAFNTITTGVNTEVTQCVMGPGLTVGAPTAQITPTAGDLNCQRLFVQGLPVTAFGAPAISWIVGASPNGAVLFVADRACTVATARAVIVTTGNAGSTLTLKKNNTTTLNSTAFALDGATGAATITLTTPASLVAGDYINITTSGTVTTGAGNVTVYVS